MHSVGVAVRVLVRPLLEDAVVDLGMQLDTPDRRGEARGLDLPLRGAREHHRARPARPSRCRRSTARRRSCRRGRASGRRCPASSVQPIASSPSCWPRGLRAAAPPSATATSWWPRQIPRVGVRRSAASRTRSLVGASQGWSASSFAPIDPPSTTNVSWPARSSGSASPAYGRRTSRTQPASRSQSPTIGRRAVVLVLDDQHVSGRARHGAGARIQSTSQVSRPGLRQVCGEVPGKVIASPAASVSEPVLERDLDGAGGRRRTRRRTPVRRAPRRRCHPAR